MTALFLSPRKSWLSTDMASILNSVKILSSNASMTRHFSLLFCTGSNFSDRHSHLTYYYTLQIIMSDIVNDMSVLSSGINMKHYKQGN